MHIIIGVLSLVALASFWLWRLRDAKEMTGELMDAANDVRLAARRFGFRRRRDQHPVESIDDARVAGAGVIAALMAQPGLNTEERRRTWVVQMQSVFDTSRAEAEELATLGAWLVSQCQTPSMAVGRLARRLYKLAGTEALPDMERMVAAIFADASGNLPESVTEGLADLRGRFRG